MRIRNQAAVQRVSQIEDAVLEIIYPTEGRLRARKVVTRSKARSTMKYPSWKMGRMVQAESAAERNAFVLLDADPTVSAFYEQPLAIRYRLNGEERAHYPDILVERSVGLPGNRYTVKQLWEVKTRADAQDPDTLARTQFLERALPNHGFEYRLVLAEDVSIEPRLSNALTLLDHGRQPADELAREHIRRVFQATDFLRWECATDGSLGDRGLAVLSRLVLEGYLTFDWNEKLSGDTRVYVAPPADRWRGLPR